MTGGGDGPLAQDDRELWSGRLACIRVLIEGESCSRDGRTTKGPPPVQTVEGARNKEIFPDGWGDCRLLTADCTLIPAYGLRLTGWVGGLLTADCRLPTAH